MYRYMFLIGVNVALAAQPPDLRKGTGEARIHAIAGENTSLYCPVKENVDFVLWSKGDESLKESNSRLKFTSKGTLKIQKVTERDAGRYKCTAINGFGKASANVTLIVLVGTGPLLEYDNGEERPNYFPDSGNAPVTSVSGKPRFKDGYPKDSSRIVQQTTERSVVFRCHPQGVPVPIVDWYKDGVPLREAEDRRIKIFRWKIELNYLKLTDAGIYGCVARNEHGSASLNYTLRVTRPILSKPEFIGHDPVNTTVFEGGMANFQCRVRSTVKPHINWLKLVPEDGEHFVQTRLIRFDGYFYQVLNSTEVLDHPDGSFLNKLNIARTTLADTGKYVCWAANTQGFIHSVAYLRVLRKPLTESASGIVSGNPITVVIATSLTILMLLACAVGMLRCVNNPVTEDPNVTVPKDPRQISRKKLIRATDESSSNTDHSRVKVHHYPKTQHHHYHQHSHRLGEVQY